MFHRNDLAQANGRLAVLVMAGIFTAGVHAEMLDSSDRSPDLMQPQESQNQSGAMVQMQNVSVYDRRLMRDLAYANLSAISIGRVAQRKSSSEDVRNFAQTMIDDHTQAMNELQQLAQAKGVSLPAVPDMRHQVLEKRLSALSGATFDRQYMAQIGQVDHRQVHRLVMNISAHASDPDLRALGAKLQPSIDEHLRMAQQHMSGNKMSSQPIEQSSGGSK